MRRVAGTGKRSLPGVALLVGVLVVGMSCGEESWRGAKSKPTVEMWFPGGLKAQLDVLRAHARAFEQEHAIQIEISQVGWDEMRHKLRLAVDAGSAPHVVKAGFDMPLVYAAMGRLVPLDPFIVRDKVDLNDYAPSLVEACEFKGNLYGVPFGAENRAIYYRKDLFKEAGVSPPDTNWTWEDLKEIARRLNSPPKVYGYGVMAGLNDQDTMCWFEPILKSFGGDYFDLGYEKSLLDSEPAIRAFRFYTDFVKEGLCPLDCITYGRDDVEAGFLVGKFAMIQSGPWLMKRLHLQAPELEGKWDVAPMPGAVIDGEYRRYVFSAGVVLMMFDHGEKENEASWQWIKYCTATAQQRDWYELELALASFSGIESGAWSKPEDEERLQRAFVPYLGCGDPPPRVVSRESFGPNAPVPVALHEILVNGKSPEEAASIAANMYEDQLEQAIYRP